MEDILKEYSKIVELCGGIPSSGWLNSNGYSYLHSKGVKLGLSLPEIREKLGVSDNLRLVSYDGQCWRSFPECSIANFLICRGVSVKVGELYPKEFEEYSGLKKAQFDMHIIGEVGDFTGKSIDIEIWGGGIRYNDDNYTKTRNLKETFNKYKQFLGIDYKASYNEKVLIEIFKPYIGIKDINIKHKIYPQILSTHFSVLNSFLKLWDTYGKYLDFKMPSIDWFRRIQVYKNRKVFDWEPFSFSCFIWHITMLGGMVKVRKLLNMSRKDNAGKEAIIDTLKLFQLTGKTPGALVKSLHKKNRSKEENEVYTVAVKTANRARFVGGHRKLCERAGILNLMKERQKQEIQDTKEWGLRACKEFYDKYKLTPGTIYSQLYKTQTLTKEEKQIASECIRLIHVSKLFGGQTNFYKLSGLIKENHHWV
jgi:hypothetical protein